MQAASRLTGLVDAGPLVHRVEDLLGAGFGAQPYGLRPGAPQSIDSVLPEEQIRATQALERGGHAFSLDKIGEALHPAGLEAKDVVDEPDVVGVVGRFEPLELGDDTLGAADVVPLAPDRLGAPVAVIGAATRRGHVHREVAVPRRPDLAVTPDIDQVPGRQRQHVEVGEVGPARRHDDPVAAFVTKRHATDGIQRHLAPATESIEELRERYLALPVENEVRAVGEVERRAVGGVGAGDDDGAAMRAGPLHHGKRRLSHP